jgi:hypothetical protein
MLTRKDFVSMAATIALLKPIVREAKAKEYAKVAAKSNPRFNKIRFLVACNVKP